MAENKYLPQKAKQHALKKAEEKALERIVFAAKKAKLESAPVETKGLKSELFEAKGQPTIVKGSTIDPDTLQSKIKGTTQKIQTKTPQKLISGSQLSKKTDDILKQKQVKRNLLKTLQSAEDAGDLTKSKSVRKILSKLGSKAGKLARVVPGLGAIIGVGSALASGDAAAAGNAAVDELIPGGLEGLGVGGDEALEKLKREYEFQKKADAGELEDAFGMFGGKPIEEREQMSRLARKSAIEKLRRR